MSKAYLVLSNGRVFEGTRIGAEHDTVGEVVFTTGMVGYLETLTDPSYAGQIITQTFPLIGNYGVIEEDFEGRAYAKGYIVRELCETPSNFRSQYPLDQFLKEHDIPGIAGIDTRELTRILREEGVMNGKILSALPARYEAGAEGTGTPDAEPKAADEKNAEIPLTSETTPAEEESPGEEPAGKESPDWQQLMEEIRGYTVTGVVDLVGRHDTEVFPAEGLTAADTASFHVVLIDYGAKQNIIRSLCRRGCRVTAVPHTLTAGEILALKPDGIMLSNGPGDPAENTFCIGQIRKLIGKVPVFGICLGHQLTALAMGGQTIKLKYGHHGANQPVRETGGRRTYITSQNHNYAVVAGSLGGVGREIFANANDQSCEGMEYPGKMCFTVQFHPEACGGPHDTEFLFDRFIESMKSFREGKEAQHAEG